MTFEDVKDPLSPDVFTCFLCYGSGTEMWEPAPNLELDPHTSVREMYIDDLRKRIIRKCRLCRGAGKVIRNDE